MHILIITQYFPPETGAASVRMSDYALVLSNLGIRVTVITSTPSYQLAGDDSQDDQRLQNLRIVRCRTRKWGATSVLGRGAYYLSFMVGSLIKGFGIGDIDLIWVTTPPITTAVSGYLLSRIKRVPYALDVRDLWPDSILQLGALKNSTAIRFLKWIEKLLYRHAQVITVAVPGFQKHIRSVCKLSPPILALPNGVSEEFIAPHEHRVPPELQGIAGKRIVLYSGNHGLAQGLEVILGAAELLRSSSEIAFLFIGEGVAKSKLKADAQQRGLTNVLFLDPVPRSEMFHYIRTATICLVPLRNLPLFRNALPSKLFEYMALGRPVVATAVGGVPELVVDGETGLLVPPEDPVALADAIHRLLSDPVLAVQLGMAGAARARARFNVETTARQLAQLYREVLAVCVS
jgi:glycosyltransferase involved in cell wall biosynthesis